MGPHPSYGYKRDPANKHHLVIDEDTAPVVRRIFTMRASGMTYRAIAVALNEEGVPSPGTYYYQQEGRSDPRRVNHLWCNTTVKQVTHNEVYIGNMVQGRFGTLSYKSRKQIERSEDEWIRVEGTHEPLISREIWDTVVSIDEKKVRKSPAEKTSGSIFSGLLFCADCGWKMRYHSDRRRYVDGREAVIKSFLCGNYARSGRTACTIHSINETALTEIVLQDIREKALCAEHDQKHLISQIVQMKEKEKHSRIASYELELKTVAARVRELERLMQNLYEDKCTGVVPQPVFQTLMSKYEAERAQKAASLPELEQKVRTQLEARHDASCWAEIIRRYTEISELDETILFALVDRIEIGETKRVASMRVCDVKVFYRYVGNVDEALAQERRDAV